MPDPLTDRLAASDPGRSSTETFLWSWSPTFVIHPRNHIWLLSAVTNVDLLQSGAPAC